MSGFEIAGFGFASCKFVGVDGCAAL